MSSWFFFVPIQGATMATLARDLDWMRKEVMSRRRDIGFTGKSEAVIMHALRLLGPTLVKQEVVGSENR